MSRKNIAIQPHSLEVLANQHTAGDTDFHGHGPMMYLNASLYVANEYQLGLYCQVRFTETQSDWTTWQGNFTGIVFDVRNQGGQGKILSVVTPPFSAADQLNGHGTHHRDFGAGALVQSYDAVGDSDGGIFGGDDHPRVTLTFNNVMIEVEDPPAHVDIGKWTRTTLPKRVSQHV
jgi:hypothetical protein